VRDEVAGGSWDSFNSLLGETPRGNFGNLGTGMRLDFTSRKRSDPDPTSFYPTPSPPIHLKNKTRITRRGQRENYYYCSNFNFK
jgi:hypothetical protein